MDLNYRYVTILKEEKNRTPSVNKNKNGILESLQI